MPALVALDLPPGPAFVDALQRVWASGEAVAPLDVRLARAARAQVVAALAPAAVVDADGRHELPADEARPVEPDDALVVATSGTTGRPRGVVLTHEALAASATATSDRLGVDPHHDHWVACLPLAHVGGLSVVVRSLLTATPLTVLERFEASAVEALAAQGATLVSLVATALRRTDVSGYRAVLLGGAAPPEGLPANVVTTYGMTETGSGVVYDGWPLDGVEVCIGDGSLGAPGEILVRGPMLLRAYRDGADPRLVGGWLPTGDGGELAGDGRLVVHGRLADVVVTGAEKVWPVPVERVIARSDRVADVAVWKRPDAEWGERVVAWVVPVDPGAPPLLGELHDLVAEAIAPWAAPKEIVLTDALPRTRSGKVRRSALR